MLIQFTVGNFMSFKDKATISLEATSDEWLEEDNIAFVSGQRFLKSAAIYGPNAGGKSNFLNAMMLFRNIVRESSKETQQGEPIPVTPFRLHATTENSPTFFEAVFLHEGTRYRYGFEASRQAISSEWLFSQANSIRETRLFTREGGEFEVAEAFKEGKGLGIRTRSNALFLSVSAQFNGKIAGMIMSWVNHIRSISGLKDQAYIGFTAEQLSDPIYGPLIRKLAKQADTGIENLERREVAAEKLGDLLPGNVPQEHREQLLRTMKKRGVFAIKTSHKRYDIHGKPSGLVEFDLGFEESSGTEKFIALTGPFLHTLREGAVLLVDELEARLHPLLTKALVGLFNSSANQKNAQLIFATHDDGLLDPKHIRRDQIWFVEKNGFGASRLFCLDEIKGVRKEARFGKEYLLGQFGGVPRVGDMQGVLSHASK